MSFTINSGKVWTTNEVITAQKLNDMLGEAVATGLVTADMAAGYRLFDVAAIEPTATDGYPWIDGDGFLRIGDGTRFQYDSGVAFFQNKTGTTLAKGQSVVVDPATTDGVKFGSVALDRNRVLGTCLTDTASNSFAPIMYRGLAQVNIVTVAETNWQASGGAFRNGYFVALESSSGSTGNSKAFSSFDLDPFTEGHMIYYGHLLENPGTVGSAWVATLYWCKIHK